MDIYYLDGKTVKKGKTKDLAKLKNKKIWVDVTDTKKGDAALLRKVFNLHPVTEEDLLLSHGRIKVEQFPNYMFCTFYSIERKPHAKKIKLVALDYVIGKKFIISTHKTELPSYERLKREKEDLKFLFGVGTDAMFHRLLDEEIDNFFPVLERIDDEIENIDSHIATSHRPEALEKILEIKNKIIEIKKITFPQREMLGNLVRRRWKFLSASSQPYFRDIFDHAIRVSDVIESYRESMSSTFDAYMTAIGNYTNEVMKVLSIVATIALPLSVISGIWGTNFFNLPGMNREEGFWIMIIVMNIMIISMLIFFRKRRWI